MNASWEEKFNILLKEYSILSSEHNQLKLSYDRLRIELLSIKQENSLLQNQLSLQKLQYQSPHPNLNLSNALNHSLSDSFSSAAHMHTSMQAFQFECLEEIPSKALTPWKTPQPNPDNSISSENFSTSIFEAFFIIGPSKLSTPEILYEYPEKNSISAAIKKVMPNLALPFVKLEELTLTGSASELNKLIFGQVNSKRNENVFVFTLCSDCTTDEIFSDLPNANHEVLYFTCLIIEDISEIEGREWIVNKSYCVASYIPVFELHYETLNSVLLLKRLFRMELLQSTENEISGLNFEITDEGIELLSKLAEINNFEEVKKVKIKTNSLDCLNYQLNVQLEHIDICWLCIPLFSSLCVEDFCWLISALSHEKSIIFVSNNLGLLTSCVLAMKALIRPLKWLNLMIPIIPELLRDFLEAPVPILAGISHIDAKIQCKYPNIVWVLLDENQINHKIQCSTHLFSEVTELPEGLFLRIKAFYSFDEQNLFEKNQESQENALKIALILKEYWADVISKFNVNSVKNFKHSEKIIEKFSENEQSFIRELVRTQLFMNTLDSEQIN